MFFIINLQVGKDSSAPVVEFVRFVCKISERNNFTAKLFGACTPSLENSPTLKDFLEFAPFTDPATVYS